MDKRSLITGTGVLLAGVLLGVLLVLGIRSLSERPGDGVAAVDAEEATPVQRETRPAVQIGNPDPPQPVAVPELMNLNTLFRGVAARVTPTVVFIEVESPADARTREFEEAHPFLNPRRFRRSAGSGVIISEQGHVVTNAHVIQGATRISVLLNDKREFEAEVVGVDLTTDMAVIRLLDAHDLPLAVIGESDELEVGEWVIAVGNPFRLTSTVTAGIVSALGRQVDIIDDNLRIEDFIQTDAAINPGNSGGALVNLRGELIGIATAIATESGVYEGYGFAVPSRLMMRVVTDLIEYGEVQRGYLMVTIGPVTADIARRRGLERIAGVVVDEVAPDGAAARAGIRTDDILLAIDDREVDAPNQFQSVIAQKRPGETIRVTLWRRGSIRELEARLTGREDEAFQRWVAEAGVRPAPPRPERTPRPHPMPDPDLNLYEPDMWGVGLRDLTPEDRQQFGIEEGAYVVFVRPGGATSADGLPSRTVIIEIEGERVGNAAQAQVLLERLGGQRESALFRVQRADGTVAFYDVEAPGFME